MAKRPSFLLTNHRCPIQFVVEFCESSVEGQARGASSQWQGYFNTIDYTAKQMRRRCLRRLRYFRDIVDSERGRLRVAKFVVDVHLQPIRPRRVQEEAVSQPKYTRDAVSTTSNCNEQNIGRCGGAR